MSIEIENRIKQKKNERKSGDKFSLRIPACGCDQFPLRGWCQHVWAHIIRCQSCQIDYGYWPNNLKQEGMKLMGSCLKILFDAKYQMMMLQQMT